MRGHFVKRRRVEHHTFLVYMGLVINRLKTGKPFVKTNIYQILTRCWTILNILSL